MTRYKKKTSNKNFTAKNSSKN